MHAADGKGYIQASDWKKKTPTLIFHSVFRAGSAWRVLAVDVTKLCKSSKSNRFRPGDAGTSCRANGVSPLKFGVSPLPLELVRGGVVTCVGSAFAALPQRTKETDESIHRRSRQLT
jgi:UDP-N-acetylglucosamine:LPS N-acetylglucosamine transferase